MVQSAVGDMLKDKDKVTQTTPTLLLPCCSWLSLKVSRQVLNTISEVLILPASLSLSPSLLVREVRSEPAKSTSDS